LVPHVYEGLAVQEAIIRALAKALLLRFPKLKPLLSEKDLVLLLTQSWETVHSWAAAHGKSVARAAVEFRRSAFAVMKRLARRPKEAPVAGALVQPVELGGLVAGLNAYAAAVAKVQDEITNDSRRRLAGEERT
jgi:hypothetical protein